MSNIEGESTSRIVAFRCPLVLIEAMAAAAAEGDCSVSTVARQALRREMRERGFLPAAQKKGTEPA